MLADFGGLDELYNVGNGGDRLVYVYTLLR